MGQTEILFFVLGFICGISIVISWFKNKLK